MYDALLLVSFGGPNGRDEVIPFLENVLRGRNVPRERMLEVAEHYYDFDGVSPINQQNRELIAALAQVLAARGPNLPIYWGNRNWHPLLTDTMQTMADDGIRHALAIVTSAFSCYSGCRQYREDIQRAREVVGEGAPVVDKLRVFFNHPGFIEASVERVKSALAQLPADHREHAPLLFTAHSIPLAMAAGSLYVTQLEEACRLVAEAVNCTNWKLVYQSRSGPPQQPWLEPDVCDYLAAAAEQQKLTAVVVVPIGFVSDHMEVLYDLDTEARAACENLGITMVRAQTVGTHPLFIEGLRELVLERMTPGAACRALGLLGPSHDVCPIDCCPSGRPQR
jgi:ferrochelatase